jgi:RHS repeat-associated protein
LHREVLRTQGRVTGGIIGSTRYDKIGRITQQSRSRSGTIDSIAAKATNTPDSSRNTSKNSLNTQNNSSNASKTLLDQFYTWDASDNLIAKVRQEYGAGNTAATSKAKSSATRQLLSYDATGMMMGSTQGTVASGAAPSSASSTNLSANQATTLRETFSYDPAGNVVDGMFGSRSSSNSGKGTGYVAHNKVIVFEDKRYQYDAFGRLSEKRSSKHGLQTFAYDAEHRLIQVTKHESTGYKQTATQTTKFTYDALGRRTSKTHSTGDAYSPETKTTFSWDGLRLLSETTQTVRGDKTSLYIYADSESYEPLARVDTIDSIAAQAINTPANDDSIDENSSNNPPKPKIFHFHNDLNGLPQELSTEGEFVWKATYKVWGNVATEEWTGEYQHAQQLGETQNLRFQGQYYDQETGLHYNTFRFFDPDVGRFTTTDPIGLFGGINLYQYSPNPDGWADPLGLAKKPPNKNSNSTVGDWILYDVDDPAGGKAKTGIGKTGGKNDTMATTGQNRRATASARKVAKDPKFPNAKATQVGGVHKGITKGQMKEIEAKRVRDLRSQGYKLPHNKENDKRYKPPAPAPSGKPAGRCK